MVMPNYSDPAAFTAWLQSEADEETLKAVLNNRRLPSAARALAYSSAPGKVLEAALENRGEETKEEFEFPNDLLHLFALARNPDLTPRLLNTLFWQALNGSKPDLLGVLLAAGYRCPDELRRAEFHIDRIKSGDPGPERLITTHFFDLTEEDVGAIRESGRWNEVVLSHPNVTARIAHSILVKDRGVHVYLVTAAQNPAIANDYVVRNLILGSMDVNVFKAYAPLADAEARGEMVRLMVAVQDAESALGLLEAIPAGEPVDLSAKDVLPLNEHEDGKIRERAICALSQIVLRDAVREATDPAEVGRPTPSPRSRT